MFKILIVFVIRKIKIQNFKSISELEFEIGRFNVLIGENGCGKSNILEAIALGAAASSNQLEKQFLVSRGIRVPKAELMRSGFKKSNLIKEIKLDFEIKESSDFLIDKVVKGRKPEDVITEDLLHKISFKLQNSNKSFSDWYDVERDHTGNEIANIIQSLIKGNEINENNQFITDEEIKNLDLAPMLRNMAPDDINDLSNNITVALRRFAEDQYLKVKYDLSLAGFAIYSPENSFLRKFEDEP